MRRKELEQKLAELHTDSYAWALRCCAKRVSDAEEVLQISYLKILERKAIYKEQASFKTWLFAVIRFTAIDYYRTQARTQTKLALVSNQLSEGLDEEQKNPKAALLKQALEQLSPLQQQVLHLVFYQNCTIQEAAEIMKMLIGTARTHYKRGKQQLRKRLEQTSTLK